MEFSQLTALCPLDGRYLTSNDTLRSIFSEYGLIHHRYTIEIKWLMAFLQTPDLGHAVMTAAEKKQLEKLLTSFDLNCARAIKKIEETTQHDVKAVEYFIKQQLQADPILKERSPYVHILCTSEDINNLAYALMIKTGKDCIVLPALKALFALLCQKAQHDRDTAMLARTHGQAASPTTVGKEWVNFAARLNNKMQQLAALPVYGKLNGAVGNYNAHKVAYPEHNWPDFCQSFVSKLGLTFNPWTTQIEPHDYLADILNTLSSINTILIDLSRDLWSYISMGYFTQAAHPNAVGSSTMPHKINPIDFENAEGNLGMANAICRHMAEKLPISRWQRDLSDSTVLRNLGLCFGYSQLAYRSLQKGLEKISVNTKRLGKDLHQSPEVLSEAVQSVLRRYGSDDAYEQLKTITRGKQIDHPYLSQYISSTHLPAAAKAALLALQPDGYTGYASELVDHFVSNHGPHANDEKQ